MVAGIDDRCLYITILFFVNFLTTQKAFLPLILMVETADLPGGDDIANIVSW